MLETDVYNLGLLIGGDYSQLVSVAQGNRLHVIYRPTDPRSTLTVRQRVSIEIDGHKVHVIYTLFYTKKDGSGDLRL
jgi:hypothetical protein